MANEREPDSPLPVDFVPERAVATHRVSDGEDWASVAAQYDVEVDDLIYFNFHTNVPEEVNWYLRRNTGCDVSNDGGLNWAFSDSAYPGLIYIPFKVIDMPPEDITAKKPVMQRIQEIANNLPGDTGERIRRVLAIESLADPYQTTPFLPGIQKDRLWYYNPGAVSFYIDLLTTNDVRRGMTNDTNGQFPFDGDIGPGFKQSNHEWRIYPFGDIVLRDAANPQSDSSLKIWLEGTEDEINKSWLEMANVEEHFAAGGGGAPGPLVDAFLRHVHDLAETPTHLYFIYQDH
jgi:hypothetical protein